MESTRFLCRTSSISDLYNDLQFFREETVCLFTVENFTWFQRKISQNSSLKSAEAHQTETSQVSGRESVGFSFKLQIIQTSSSSAAAVFVHLVLSV